MSTYYKCILGLLLWMIVATFARRCSDSAQAAEVNKLTFQVGKLFNRRDPYLPDYTLLKETRDKESQSEQWNHQIGLHLDITLASLPKSSELYWVQNVVGESTTHQYRRVYWDFEWGVSLLGKVDVFHHHRSEHVLEVSKSGYPLMDVYGLRFCFIGTRCDR